MPKYKSVLEDTFKSWDCSNDFLYNLDDEKRVTNLRCIPCSDNWKKVELKASSLKGNAKGGLKRYVDGVSLFVRANVMKHVTGELHLYSKSLSSDSNKNPPTVVKFFRRFCHFLQIPNYLLNCPIPSI